MRIGLGAAMFAAPVPAARLAGIDTGTARRISWLARMTAARDAALGAGALTAVRGDGDPARWVLAGAASDLVDALVVLDAVRRGRLGRLRGGAVVAASVSGVLAGVVAAGGLRRR